MKNNSVEISLFFTLPSMEGQDLQASSNKLLAEFSDDDVILGLGSLRENRLGVAFFLDDASQQQDYASRITQRVCQAWPGARLRETKATPVSGG